MKNKNEKPDASIRVCRATYKKLKLGAVKSGMTLKEFIDCLI